MILCKDIHFSNQLNVSGVTLFLNQFKRYYQLISYE